MQSKFLHIKYLKKKVLKLIKNYNLIIKAQKIFNKHFNKIIITLLTFLVLLLFIFLDIIEKK